MEELKTRLRVVIFFNFNILEKAICEYIKKETGDIDIDIKVCSDHASLYAALESGDTDVLFTEYYFLHKNCSTGEQKQLKMLCNKRSVKTLIFLQQTDPHLINKVVQSEFDALISAHDSIEEFHHALCHLTSGTEKSFVSKVLREAKENNVNISSDVALTSKEWEVIFLVVQGHSLSTIAARKNRAVSTVATQKHSAMKKLNVTTNGELLKYAYLNGML
ncbi:LuxR C-terminal-related transcriptional regulator [Erwinia oleae]|uniref:LuxR C-terminal-related transcriptional regulator n=1 Tax=Erwinia oleae TaxID=796334 RepID=UPI000ADCB682|nr:LuxR C-terminal-related transcriptional regulator [Erwinia oleae]